MANINFTEFNLRTSPLTGDFLVGYDESASNEIRMEIKDVLSLVNSAKYESVYSSVNVASANWDSVYSNVNVASANWNSVYSSVNSNSAKYESVYSSVNVTSANWDSVYSNVNSNSASWDSVVNVKHESSTNYILQQSDVDSLLTFNTTTLTLVIIPTDSVLNVPIGSHLTVMRKGSGFVDLSASFGVNLLSVNSFTFLKNVNSIATLIKLNNDEWLLHGDLDFLIV